MDEIDALKEKVLLAALPQVPFDGWSDLALRRGAESEGLPASDAARAFPGGPAEAIDYYNFLADRHMLEALEKADLDSMRTRDRVILAVRTRLEQNAAHREAIRRGVTFLSFPPYAPIALRSLHRTVDAIWLAAGDKATDFNWYTKRGLLAGVYSATVLYWLNDKSEGFADTWAFLERRIDTVLRVGGFLGRMTRSLGEFPTPFGRPRRPTAE